MHTHTLIRLGVEIKPFETREQLSKSRVRRVLDTHTKYALSISDVPGIPGTVPGLGPRLLVERFRVELWRICGSFVEARSLKTNTKPLLGRELLLVVSSLRRLSEGFGFWVEGWFLDGCFGFAICNFVVSDWKCCFEIELCKFLCENREVKYALEKNER